MYYEEIPGMNDKKSNIKFMGYCGKNIKRIQELLKLDNIFLELDENIIKIYSNNMKKIIKTKKYIYKYFKKHFCKSNTNKRTFSTLYESEASLLDF